MTKAETTQPLRAISIRFGCVVPPLGEQLEGFGISNSMLDHFQLDMEAINRLKIRSIIPESVSKKAYDKLFKTIQKHISTL